MRTSLLVTAMVLALGAGAAIADWIELTNKNRIRGEIGEERDDGTVWIELEGGHVVVPRSAIVGTTKERPAEEGREVVSHRGGASLRLAEVRYLDGWNPDTRSVDVPVFKLLKPVGEIAHGTLVRVEERRVINGTEMARVSVGEAEGWVPAASLRDGSTR